MIIISASIVLTAYIVWQNKELNRAMTCCEEYLYSLDSIECIEPMVISRLVSPFASFSGATFLRNNIQDGSRWREASLVCVLVIEEAIPSMSLPRKDLRELVSLVEDEQVRVHVTNLVENGSTQVVRDMARFHMTWISNNNGPDDSADMKCHE